LLLESARTLPPVETPAGEGIGAAVAYPLLATFLLSGGRRAEVLGLELDDVSFDRGTITFRLHAHRRLKTRTSWRVAPLFPELEKILRAYVFGARLERGGRLLFPSFATGSEAMLIDVSNLIDRIGVRAGWKAGELGTRVFRHTWTAARLQTLDRGAPVSLYTVSRELGHGSEEMVRRVYAHLGTVRHRSEVVEFRIEQHAQALKDRLGAMAFVARNDTAAGQGVEREAPQLPVSDSGAKVSESGPGATRTRDLLLRSRPRPATASARQRNSLGKQFITASRRQPAPARLLLGTLLGARAMRLLLAQLDSPADRVRESATGRLQPVPRRGLDLEGAGGHRKRAAGVPRGYVPERSRAHPGLTQRA
jgi:hypothetical protein